MTKSNVPGGGNACIRPLRSQGHAIGIPTGDLYTGGFSSLNQVMPSSLNMPPGMDAKKMIDSAFNDLDHLILNDPRKRFVLYCSDAGGVRIGSGIFSVSGDVLDYITLKLRSLPKRVYHLM